MRARRHGAKISPSIHVPDLPNCNKYRDNQYVKDLIVKWFLLLHFFNSQIIFLSSWTRLLSAVFCFISCWKATLLHSSSCLPVAIFHSFQFSMYFQATSWVCAITKGSTKQKFHYFQNILILKQTLLFWIFTHPFCCQIVFIIIPLLPKPSIF